MINKLQRIFSISFGPFHHEKFVKWPKNAQSNFKSVFQCQFKKNIHNTTRFYAASRLTPLEVRGHLKSFSIVNLIS